MQGQITKLLEKWKAGNAAAGEAVVALTYGELRRLAHGQMRRERPGHVLQTTALLHEAYLRLLRKGPGSVTSREAFFRLMAAGSMEKVLASPTGSPRVGPLVGELLRAA
jgi:hypothetical protein